MSTYRVTFPRVMRSEWTKLRSLRSTLWSLAVALGFMVLFSVLVPSVVVSQTSTRGPSQHVDVSDPTVLSLAGAGLAQLAIGILGILLVSGEYSTGMIRASLTAVPARVPVLLAKAVVYAATVLVLMLPAAFAAFFIGQSILAQRDLDASLSDPHVLRVVLGTALYMAALGLLGLALGALLRHTAGAIALLVALLMVLPPLLMLLPGSFGETVSKYSPGRASEALVHATRQPDLLGPWTGFLVFCLYWAGGLALASYLLTRRDA